MISSPKELPLFVSFFRYGGRKRSSLARFQGQTVVNDAMPERHCYTADIRTATGNVGFFQLPKAKSELRKWLCFARREGNVICSKHSNTTEITLIQPCLTSIITKPQKHQGKQKKIQQKTQ
jgi:hypothetical protein